jgi:excisionase family DNA binding protein
MAESPARLRKTAMLTRRKEVLTTGEVARICHVAPRTVSKWFDTGQLTGYRIPGSRDRRIPREQLLQFMRMHGMPLKELEGNVIRVLVVDPDSAALAVAKSLSAQGRYEVRSATNDFEAGMRAEEFRPHVVLVSVVAEGVDSAQILRNLRANQDLASTKVVSVGGALTRGQKGALLREGFDAVLCKPFTPADLTAVIEQATDIFG